MNEAPFRSWTLANFEILANILICATAIIVAFVRVPSEEIADAYWVVQYYSAIPLICICALLGETSAIGFLSDLVRLLVCVGVVVGGLYYFKEDAAAYQYYKSALTAAIVAAVAGGLLAIAGMRFAYSNFEEVVSRRMRYRNSSVDLFDVQWKYAFNRFVVIFCYFIIFLPLLSVYGRVDWTVLLK